MEDIFWLPIDIENDNQIQNGCLLKCRNEFITVGYYSIFSKRFLSHAGIIDDDNPVCFYIPLSLICRLPISNNNTTI